jgi:hypothetical protein
MWAEDWHPWADHDPRYGPAGRYRPFARAPPPYARRVHPVIPPPPPQRFFPPGPPRFYPPMILPPRLPELTTPHAGGDMREQPRDSSREIPTVQLWSDFDEPVKPQVIKFGVDTSAIRCVVSWKLPDLQGVLQDKQNKTVLLRFLVKNFQKLSIRGIFMREIVCTYRKPLKTLLRP